MPTKHRITELTGLEKTFEIITKNRYANEQTEDSIMGNTRYTFWARSLTHPNMNISKKPSHSLNHLLLADIKASRIFQCFIQAKVSDELNFILLNISISLLWLCHCLDCLGLFCFIFFLSIEVFFFKKVVRLIFLQIKMFKMFRRCFNFFFPHHGKHVGIKLFCVVQLVVPTSWCIYALCASQQSMGSSFELPFHSFKSWPAWAQSIPLCVPARAGVWSPN